MKKVVAVVLMMILLLPCMVQAESLEIDNTEIKRIIELYELESTLNPGLGVVLMQEGKTKQFNINSISNEMVGRYIYLKADTDKVKHDQKCPFDSNNDCSIMTKQTYEDIYKELFGPSLELKKNTDKEAALCNVYTYDATSDSYYTASRCGFTGVTYDSYVLRAEKNTNDETILVYLKGYELHATEDSSSSELFNLDGTSTEIKLKNDLTKNKIKNEYSDYINTYKFTFKKASDNNYYFYSVENMKDAKEYKASATTNTSTKTTTTKKVSNPNTADKNIFLLLTTGIIMFAVILYSGKKLFVRR